MFSNNRLYCTASCNVIGDALSSMAFSPMAQLGKCCESNFKSVYAKTSTGICISNLDIYFVQNSTDLLHGAGSPAIVVEIS